MHVEGDTQTQTHRHSDTQTHIHPDTQTPRHTDTEKEPWKGVRGRQSSLPSSSHTPLVLHLSLSDYPTRPEWTHSGPFQPERE